MRLLLIEDNLRLAGHVCAALQGGGFTVDHCASLDEADAAVDATRFDLAVLDLGLPDGDGMDFLRRLRGQGNSMPILVLTARDTLEDRVEGLNSGADDYLLKPFEVAELIARINALLRRPGNALGAYLQVGNLSFDTIGREVLIGDRVTGLSRR